MNSDTLWCESCGEAEQEIAAEHAGLCGDCFGKEANEALSENGLGNFCCRPLFQNGTLRAICMQPYGTEHSHD